MMRWLRAAREGPAALTKPTELTKAPVNASKNGVLSVKSVLSGGGEINADTFAAWEERAAIREYDGGQSREDAEFSAARDIGLRPDDLRRIQGRGKKGERHSTNKK